jgi:hypothetical protein
LKYRIYRSYTQGVFGQKLAETQQTFFNDSDANTLAAVIYYRIRAVDSADYEDAGTQDYQITVTQPIDPPATLVARPGNNRVTLNWKKTLPDYYNIYRSEDPLVYGAPVAYNVPFDGREYIDADPLIQNKTAYYYTIAAVTRGGEGPRSNVASAVPYAPPDMPVRDVTCSILEKKDVLVRWSKAVPADGGYDITGYNIYRSGDNGWTYTKVTFTAYLAPAGAPEYVTVFVDTTTQWSNKYIYMIRVVDYMGNTDSVYNLGTVELPLPKNRVKMHANLTDLSKGQSLTWQYVLTDGGKFKVTVYTLSGAYVKTLIDSSYDLPVSTSSPYESAYLEWDGTNSKGKKVASGVYMFVLELNGQKTIEKIAVIR